MKHMACILLIITVLFAGFAVAEDYAAYTISDTYYAQSAPTVMANGDLFYRVWFDRDGTCDDDHPWHLLWVRDGKTYRDFPYTTEGTQLPWSTALVLDGTDEQSCTLLLSVLSDTQLERLGQDHGSLEMVRWTENGMEPIKSISGDWEARTTRVLHNGFSAWNSDLGVLSIFDQDGTLVADVGLTAGEENHGHFSWIAGDVAGTCACLLRLSPIGEQHERYRLYGIANGDVVWTRDLHAFCSVEAPGDGSLYLLTRTADAVTSPVLIEKINGHGKSIVSKTLSADKLVLSTQLTYASATGQLLLTGGAVSNSRNISIAYQFTLDEYLKPTTVDTRVFQYSSDHTFSTLVQTDGSSWVFCPGYGLDEATDMPPVMVPFDVLPTADNAYGLTLK